MMNAIDEMLKFEADERAKLHANHATSRPLSHDYEWVGLAGEAEFARAYGLALDLNRRPNGDGRIDFTIPLAFTVDVKTARMPFNLIEEQGKVSADIYVLAQCFDETRSAKLLGWGWGKTLAKAPVRDFRHGIMDHYIPRESLKPMAALQRRIMVLRTGV